MSDVKITAELRTEFGKELPAACGARTKCRRCSTATAQIHCICRCRDTTRCLS